MRFRTRRLGPCGWEDADWHDTIDVNLTGTCNAIRAVAPHLVRNGGGRIILIGEPRAVTDSAVEIEQALLMPPTGAHFAPIVYAVPIQMLAYHTAVIMGKDADQPRNLAKSVTVE